MRKIGSWMRRLSVAGAATVAPLLSQGQGVMARPTALASSTPLVGVVRDTAGRPISGVEMRIAGQNTVLARTNDDGGFRVAAMEVGSASIALRRLGYAPSVVEVRVRSQQIDSLVIALYPLAFNLPGVLVEDEALTRSKRVLSGFWRRRENGFGAFMTRDEIENRNTSQFADLLRMMPGVRIVPRNGRSLIRFSRNTGPRDCPPQYFVNGLRIENGQPEEFNPSDIEAIEVYSGISVLPMEFAPRPLSYTCGAVVIWTRIQ